MRHSVGVFPTIPAFTLGIPFAMESGILLFMDVKMFSFSNQLYKTWFLILVNSILFGSPFRFIFNIFQTFLIIVGIFIFISLGFWFSQAPKPNEEYGNAEPNSLSVTFRKLLRTKMHTLIEVELVIIASFSMIVLSGIYTIALSITTAGPTGKMATMYMLLNIGELVGIAVALVILGITLKKKSYALFLVLCAIPLSAPFLFHLYILTL